jgi:dihydrofolate reductase
MRHDVEVLKATAGRDVVTTGSISLVHALVGARLVDEFRLFVHPVVVRAGRRLFPQGAATPGLRLAEVRPFGCGVVLLRCRTAG